MNNRVLRAAPGSLACAAFRMQVTGTKLHRSHNERPARQSSSSVASTRRSVNANRQRHERQILDLLGEDHLVTQRSRFSNPGIAPGRTNLLLRRLVTKGWVSRDAGVSDRQTWAS